MSKKISEFYIEELSDWIKSIGSYIDEISTLEQRLEDVIARNTVVDIAAKVEVHQMMLDNVSNKINELKQEYLIQKNELFVNDNPVADDKITQEIELKMKLNALKFSQIEKEFIDIKYYCISFLIEVLKK